MKTFKHFSQLDSTDCGPASLRMIAMHHGRHYSLDTLKKRCEYTREGVNLFGIAQAAESIGFRTLGAKLSFEELCKATLPCILHWNQQHFVVLYGTKGRGENFRLLVADPATGLVKLTENEFKKSWFSTVSNNEGRGIALFLDTTPQFYTNV